MANYYVDTSQTFNGDGSVSTAAASNGAAGAANSFIDTVTDGRPHGDKVYVRTADSGGSLTETFSGSKTGTVTGTLVLDPLTYIFDDGTVWPESGVFTLYTPSSNYLDWPDDVNIKAGLSGDHRFKFHCSNTSYSNIYHMRFGGRSIIEGFHLVLNQGRACLNLSSNGDTVMKHFRYDHDCGTVESNISPFWLGADAKCKIFDLEYNILALKSNRHLIAPTNGSLKVYGGCVNGVDPSYPMFLFYKPPSYSTSSEKAYHFEDFKLNGMKLYSEENTYSDTNRVAPDVVVSGVEDPEDFYKISDGMAIVSHIQNDAYPTKTALLEDGITNWSIHVDPYLTVPNRPINLYNLYKKYELTAAIKTLKLSLLLHEDITSFNEYSLFFHVTYVDDATGDLKFISSEGSLQVSTDTWAGAISGSQMTYGAEFYDKKELTLTTPTSIKQNSVIRMYVYSSIKRATTESDFFINPDIELS